MPRVKPPTRRADLLAAARQEFNARGFSGARMESIARAVGLSKAALYLDFPSKEALFEALTTELIEAMLPEAAPAEFGDLPAEALLRHFIAVLAQRITSDDMAFVPRVIIGEGMNFPDLARFYHDKVVARGLGIVTGIIEHGIARGELACASPPLAARSLISGMLFAAIWKLVFVPVGAQPIDPGEFAQSHADTLLIGLRARKDHA